MQMPSLGLNDPEVKQESLEAGISTDDSHTGTLTEVIELSYVVLNVKTLPSDTSL